MRSMTVPISDNLQKLIDDGAITVDDDGTVRATLKTLALIFNRECDNAEAKTKEATKPLDKVMRD